MFKHFLFVFMLVLFGCSDSPEKTMRLTEENIISADISKDAKYALIAEVIRKEEDKKQGKGKAILLDLQEEKVLYEWSHKQGQGSDINKVVLSNNGKLAITIEKKDIGIWDTKTGQNKAFWSMPNPITNIAITTSGKLGILSFYKENIGLLLNLRNGKHLRVFKFGSEVRNLDISDNGKFVVLAGSNGKVELWESFENEKVAEWQFAYKVGSVRISPDSKYLLISPLYQKIILYDIENKQTVQELAKFKGLWHYFSKDLINVSSASYTLNNEFLVTGAPPRNLYLWNTSTGDLIQSWSLPKQPSIWYPTSALVYATSINENNIISISSDGYAYFWKR